MRLGSTVIARCQAVLQTARLLVLAMLLSVPASTALAQADPIFANGFEPSLPAAPIVRILRDDHVATVEMDYDAENPWGQFWVMSGALEDDAGFLVTWWPDAPNGIERARSVVGNDAGGSCLNPDHLAAPKLSPGNAGLPPGARWLVTANRRVQIQPLDNNRLYHVRVERLNARGQISSQPFEIAFNGGDAARVAALRSSLSAFDDFNLPMGAADERLWNNAQMVSTDARFNLFFINDQLHAHTLNGTRVDNTGDKSQTSQRFRKPLRLLPTGQRRIVFDMDSPLSPRSVWYLDFNPVSADLTGHASFFDEDGALGLPAGILRLRAQFQTLSVSIVDLQGASHQIASIDMEAAGRQALSNVRRQFDVRLETGRIEVLIDGRSVINATFAPYQLPPADYELLWVGFGYNTPKDGVPYFLQHWDNLGFDGPVVDARTVHNYVTRIEGTDYQKAARSASAAPVFTINIPDNLFPISSGATAQARLVYTYQMGDYSQLVVAPTDFVKVNGGPQFSVPPLRNNTVPSNAAVMAWGMPHTNRIKLADLQLGGNSPLLVGANTFQFNVENAGILNVHLEVHYPPGSAPNYTPPSVIHHFPLHAELPRLGPPPRLTQIGTIDVGGDQWIGATNPTPIAVNGMVQLNIEVGNRSWANWAPQLMHHPVASAELWSAGGTAGIARIEVYLRPAGSGTAPGPRIALIETAVDAPVPQGRYRVALNSGDFPDGDYQLFVQATTPSGLKSHPSYGDETYHFDASALSGAYYPIPIRIRNTP